MKQSRADFGGISYTTGDFHTPGTSGLGNMNTTGLALKLRKKLVLPTPQVQLNSLRSTLASAQNERAMIRNQLTTAEGKIVSIESQIAAMKRNNPGLSGMGSLGFSLNDAFRTVFGENAEQVKANLQAGASSMAQQQISTKLQTDPNAKQGIIDTAKETAGAIIKEYWYISYPVMAFTVIALVSGGYNLFKARRK